MNGLEKVKIPIKVATFLAIGVAIVSVAASCAPETNNSNIDNAIKDSTSQNQPNSEPIPDSLKTGKTMGER